MATQAATRTAVVWIDSDGARILRWRGRVRSEKIISNVEQHVRGTLHVRHDPRVRHGGSGSGQDEAQRRRIEHMRAFLARVAARLDRDTDIEILGTGTMGGRLATLLRHETASRSPAPTIVVKRSAPLSPRQLVAHLRERVGHPARRIAVGP
jgi:hypothetical protein